MKISIAVIVAILCCSSLCFSRQPSRDLLSTARAIKLLESTRDVDPENDVLSYSYQVSAGRIVGSGANVLWDLTGIKAGTYTITVGVDDGAGIRGQTKTKTVVVE